MTRRYRYVSVVAALAGFAASGLALADDGKMSSGSDHEMQMMDTNHDGKISADEHAAGAKKMFEMMDTNKDGKVTFEEAKAGKFSEHQFKAWDLNTDGVLDKSELDQMHHVKGKEGYCS